MARTTSDIINDTIGQNRRVGILLSVFALLLSIIGAALMVYAIISSKGLNVWIGLLCNVLSLPALYGVRRIQRENASIRMLESTLLNASTSDEAVKVLNELFAKEFGKRI